MRKERFDAGYFDRFYGSRKTRVHGKARVARLARGVTEMIAWFGGDIRSVLDIGAGAGLWRDWFAENKRSVRYVSTDASAYACERFGHTQRDIAHWCGRERYDLVVCQGVLPYLSNDDAARAIENIAGMSRGFLYLEAITARDVRDICDREATDVTVKKRTGAWYRARLGEHFVRLGCGLFYRTTGPLTFWELEMCDAPRRRERFTSG